MIKDPIKYLEGGDLRSAAKADELRDLIRTQTDFDAIFHFLHREDRLLVMRAADALEKISRDHPKYLESHEDEILEFLQTAEHKEFKWHLAQMVGRLKLVPAKRTMAYKVLTSWATNSAESSIVRVNALQAIHDMNLEYLDMEKELQQLIITLKRENIPSLNSRIRKLTSS
ncbi:hypothetical protein [Sediminicola sp. 1XM1-17]|uniref:hypothetical protein n=1 Tax=Sediminicola sp. 1XM1-17 TaxID=3127702 RepID=UPI0030783257